jgi:hypothetical protein
VPKHALVPPNWRQNVVLNHRAAVTASSQFQSQTKRCREMLVVYFIVVVLCLVGCASIRAQPLLRTNGLKVHGATQKTIRQTWIRPAAIDRDEGTTFQQVLNSHVHCSLWKSFAVVATIATCNSDSYSFCQQDYDNLQQLDDSPLSKEMGFCLLMDSGGPYPYTIEISKQKKVRSLSMISEIAGKKVSMQVDALVMDFIETLKMKVFGVEEDISVYIDGRLANSYDFFARTQASRYCWLVFIVGSQLLHRFVANSTTDPTDPKAKRGWCWLLISCISSPASSAQYPSLQHNGGS